MGQGISRALADVRAELSSLESRKADVDWVARALSNFGDVWPVLSPVNQGRLLCSLVDRTIVNEDTGKLDIHLAHLEDGGGAVDPAEPNADQAAQ